MDTCVRPPVSVFTVDGQVDPVPHPLPVRRKTAFSGHRVTHLVLLGLTLLALGGVATEMYFLKRVETKLETEEEMINWIVSAQKMTHDPGLISSEQGNQPTPSAHVIAANFTRWYPTSPLHWESHLGLASLLQVKYNNGSLLCTKAGMYFIYAKLQLIYLSCPLKDDPSLFFSHGVYKKNPAYKGEIELMGTKKRYCDSNGNVLWMGNSFLGGNFHIEKGEEVYVRMSKKQLIRVKDGSFSFFGLFMV
ncbi:tumor necrosis factor ligand superfamily member 14 [Discoglossus pictus]